MNRTLWQRVVAQAFKPVASVYFRQAPNHAFQQLIKVLGYNNFVGTTSGEDHFVRNVLSKIDPRLCLDIGANKGDYSRLLLEATDTRVIAFEPLPVMANLLEELRRTYPERLRLEHCGVGDRVERLTISFSASAASHASFLPEAREIDYVENAEQVTVPVTTLDDYVSEAGIGDIDFIKIDVEGFEGRVLDGAARTIAASPPKMLQIEYNTHQLLTQESIYSLSKRLPGYEVFQLLPTSMVRRNPLSPETNIFAFSNFVFVRDDIVPRLEL